MLAEEDGLGWVGAGMGWYGLVWTGMYLVCTVCGIST